MEIVDSKRLVIEAERSKLELERKNLSEQLGLIATRLAEIETADEIDRPIQLTLTAEWLEFYDDGYTGWFRPSASYPSVSCEITTRDLSLAYLAMLAAQSHPIPENLEEERGMFDAYIAVGIQQVTLPEEQPMYPPAELKDAVSTLPKALAPLIAELREKVRDNQQYDDFPLAINKLALEDALLRRELLSYCEDSDPDFSFRRLS